MLNIVNSNKIRKTQNDHLIIVFQNLIGLYLAVNFFLLFFFLVFIPLGFVFYLESNFNFGGTFEFKSYLPYDNCMHSFAASSKLAKKFQHPL